VNGRHRQAAAASRPPGPARRPAVAHLRAMAARHIASCAADPDGWPRLLAAVAASPGLGFAGAVLAAAQEPGPAATREDWEKAGWQPGPDARARVWVLAHGDRGPRAVPVFTRRQVTPARVGASPPLPAAITAAGTADRAGGALTAVARRRDYQVTRPADAARAGTDAGQHAITIPAGLPPDRAAAALARELAFIISEENLARDGKPVRGRDAAALFPAEDSMAARSGTASVEADSVAWLVLARLGLDPAAAGITFPPAQAWAGGDPRSPLDGLVTAAGERIAAAAEQILAHAGKVLAGLPPAPPPPSPAPEPSAPARGYGQYPRARPPGRARVTARPGWPCPPRELAAVNAAAAAYYRARLPGSWAAAYLDGRGFGPPVARRWQLGYAPGGWTALLDYLRGRGFDGPVVEQAGLAARAAHGLIDCFRDRVMIPVRGPHGQVAGFAGRARDGAPGDPPKYLNTRRTASYVKDRLLYGLPEAAAALEQGARPVLVEGYFDAIAVTEAGARRLAGLAPGGTALSDAQLSLLAASSDLARTPLLVARDPDAAGRRAAARDYKILTRYCPAAAAAALPADRDPAAIFEADGPAALARLLAAGGHPLADVAVDQELAPWQEALDNGWAAGQLLAVRAAARLLAAFRPADVVRQIARVAGRTGLPHEEVAGEFAAAVAAAEPSPKGPAGDRQDRPAREFPAPPGGGRPARAARRPARAGRPAARPPRR